MVFLQTWLGIPPLDLFNAFGERFFGAPLFLGQLGQDRADGHGRLQRHARVVPHDGQGGVRRLEHAYC